jgi:DNA ligase (NAD+)
MLKKGMKVPMKVLMKVQVLQTQRTEKIWQEKKEPLKKSLAEPLIEPLPHDQSLGLTGGVMTHWTLAPPLPIAPPQGVPQEVFLRWQELVEQIDYHDVLYYHLDAPELPDQDYDRLRRALNKLHQTYPALDQLAGPLFRIGAPPDPEGVLAAYHAKTRAAADTPAADQSQTLVNTQTKTFAHVAKQTNHGWQMKAPLEAAQEDAHPISATAVAATGEQTVGKNVATAFETTVETNIEIAGAKSDFLPDPLGQSNARSLTGSDSQPPADFTTKEETKEENGIGKSSASPPDGQLGAAFVPAPSSLQEEGPKEALRLPKVSHLAPVMSLDNVFGRSEFAQFAHKVNRFLGLPSQTDQVWVAEPKIDGLTVVLRYQEGRLVHGATRGDGQVGELITATVCALDGVPKILVGQGWPDLFEVRGEAFLEKSAFDQLNRQRKAQQLPLFANARNAAAGSLRHLDPGQVAERCLRFIAHDASFLGSNQGLRLKGADFTISTYSSGMEKLASWGFKTADMARLCQHQDDCLAACDEVQAARQEMPYEIDGMVFKLNDLSLYERLGTSARSPRYAVAYKFPATQATALLQAIEIQVGRTGVLTPVAHLTPVVIAGVTVTRASLHNAQEIARKDLRVGDSVIVQRAGDVIPQVLAPVLERRPPGTSPFLFPKICPLCHSPAVQRDQEVAWRCSGGARCMGQDVWRLRHFVSRDACAIEGLGKRHLQDLYDRGLVQDLASLFSLPVQDLEVLPGWGPLSASNLVDELQKRRIQPLDRWIYSLGIPSVGQATARLLARHYVSANAFMEGCTALSQDDRSGQDDLMAVQGVGPECTAALGAAWAQHHALWNRLLAVMTVLDWQDVQASDHTPLAGKKVVFTGTLDHVTRAEAKQQAIRLGAQVQSAVSQTTDFLVAGSQSGSKALKAAQLGVRVMDEAQWTALVGGQSDGREAKPVGTEP